MQQIFIDDPAWRETLPRLVAPLSDEWFPGLLLRCDEVNCWEAGATARHLFRMPSKNHLSIPSSYFLQAGIPPEYMLEHLSQVLVIPLSCAVATTYLSELARIGVSPSKAFESRGKVSSWLLICPECLAQERLLRRTLALSHITVCPQHYLVLQYSCRCKTHLRLFDHKARPFSCPSCNLDWEQLPRIEASKERIALEQEILLYYTFLFSRVTSKLFLRILELIRKCAREQGKRYISFAGDGEEITLLSIVAGINPRSAVYRSIIKQKYASIGNVVYALIDLGLSIDDILAYAEHRY